MIFIIDTQGRIDGIKHHAVGSSYPWLLHPQIQPTVHAEDQLYAMYYAILYKEFEHSWVLLSVGNFYNQPSMDN